MERDHVTSTTRDALEIQRGSRDVHQTVLRKAAKPYTPRIGAWSYKLGHSHRMDRTYIVGYYATLDHILAK